MRSKKPHVRNEYLSWLRPQTAWLQCAEPKNNKERKGGNGLRIAFHRVWRNSTLITGEGGISKERKGKERRRTERKGKVGDGKEGKGKAMQGGEKEKERKGKLGDGKAGKGRNAKGGRGRGFRKTPSFHSTPINLPNGATISPSHISIQTWRSEKTRRHGCIKARLYT